MIRLACHHPPPPAPLQPPEAQTHRLEAMSEGIQGSRLLLGSKVSDKRQVLHNEKPERLKRQDSSFASPPGSSPSPKAFPSLQFSPGEL